MYRLLFARHTLVTAARKSKQELILIHRDRFWTDIIVRGLDSRLRESVRLDSPNKIDRTENLASENHHIESVMSSRPCANTDRLAVTGAKRSL